jgi:hypothetical protein
MTNINWRELVEIIRPQHGDVRTIGVEFYQNADGRFNEILELWSRAGYTSQKVEWINYYPGRHFDQSISEEFAKQVELTHIRSWISCVRPGKSAPWHQDIDDSMDEYLKLGKLYRYSVHIGKPAVGQVLLIDKESFYMVPEGYTFKWPDHMAWHGASNCGFENHYIFHFLGYAVI